MGESVGGEGLWVALEESSTGQPWRWRLGDTIEDTRRESVTGWPVRRGGGGGDSEY